MLDVSRLTESLDRIASTAESKGCLKEAEELDIVSNTLESEAMALTHKRRKSLSSSSFVFPANHPSVTDDDDHFPIDTENRGRNALARANQYGEAPPWYKGSLKNLKKTVAEKVKARYPGIEVTEEAINE